MKLRPWRPGKIKPLGGGATLVEEAGHFIHAMGNRLMILMMRMELRQRERKERAAAHAPKKAALRKRRRELRARRLLHERGQA